ncbi:unnamed protein product [Rangifer tarandus platyrhynchus]|uniref:Uncharacterized protein n=1 Tax=Rangifer tarandus platyrhynchus TaxID=3082113 RepID=A0ACB1KG50_RANTA
MRALAKVELLGVRKESCASPHGRLLPVVAGLRARALLEGCTPVQSLGLRRSTVYLCKVHAEDVLRSHGKRNARPQLTQRHRRVGVALKFGRLLGTKVVSRQPSTVVRLLSLLAVQPGGPPDHKQHSVKAK